MTSEIVIGSRSSGGKVSATLSTQEVQMKVNTKKNSKWTEYEVEIEGMFRIQSPTIYGQDVNFSANRGTVTFSGNLAVVCRKVAETVWHRQAVEEVINGLNSVADCLSEQKMDLETFLRFHTASEEYFRAECLVKLAISRYEFGSPNPLPK